MQLAILRRSGDNSRLKIVLTPLRRQHLLVTWWGLGRDWLKRSRRAGANGLPLSSCSLGPVRPVSPWLARMTGRLAYFIIFALHWAYFVVSSSLASKLYATITVLVPFCRSLTTAQM